MTCKQLAALTALAMGPAACDDADGSGSNRNPLLEQEGGNDHARPPTPVTGMTTYDRAAAVPGFAVGISLGGPTGEDVVLDWSGTGFTGDVTIYRSPDPVALRDLVLGAPLPAGVTSTAVAGVTSYADAGAASRTAQTPHYYYRVALGGGDGGGNGGGNGAAAYVRASDYPPWGHSSNEQAMDMVFGAEAWDDLRFETADAGALLSSQYSFIFMEGGDSNASELEAFVAANVVAIEQWVDAGGTLLLNAAPNEGGSQAWGFGGVTLNYPDFPTDPGHAVDSTHPIWNGPFLPTATSFTGNSYAHATVSGPGLVPHILDADGGNPNLAELEWGLGHVMFGGLTTADWWSPTPEAVDLRANIIGYLSDGATSGPQLSTMVMKTTTVTAPGFNRFGLCMLDGPATASEAFAVLGSGVVGVHQWNASTQSYVSWTPGSPDFPLLYGSAVVAQLDGSAQPYHSLVGVVPTDEALAVTGEPGYNWATLPVFYDGPTSTDYWLTQAGYWGVGRWFNDTQSATFDWIDPGYAPFEMEPCGAYDMYLPNNACASNDDCGEGTYCYFVEPAACGNVAAGVCMPEPLGCGGATESPVCGCDGQTYESECLAQAAGVSTRNAGECPYVAACGNDGIDAGEQCDGDALGEDSCASLGFVGGTLGCTEECTFDTSACTNDEVPAPGECDVEQDIGTATGNAVASGSLVGEDEDLVQGCGGGGVDHVVRFVAPADGTYEFNAIGSTYDTVLSLHTACGQAALTCNDDWYGLQSRVDLDMVAGQAVLVAVSGFGGQTGSWILNIDGGGEGQACEGGTDPFTGAPWVVCAADAGSAWVSHSNVGGGNYHAEEICTSLGYASVGAIGGTCGNVCGYCEGTTSCEAPGSRTFDGGGDCGADANGQILCSTVMWECLSPIGA